MNKQIKILVFLGIFVFSGAIFIPTNAVAARPDKPVRVLYQYIATGGDAYVNCRVPNARHEGFEVLFSPSRYFYPEETVSSNILKIRA